MSVWLLLPATLPNSVALLAGGKLPLDYGRVWRDGRRILGDGVSVRGTLSGIISGVLAALALNMLQPFFVNALGLAFPRFPLAAVILLPLGAIGGDALASFAKRRAGRSRGTPVLIIDQVDYAFLTIPFLFLFAPSETATLTLHLLFVAFLLIPALRYGGSVLYVQAGLKEHP